MRLYAAKLWCISEALPGARVLDWAGSVQSIVSVSLIVSGKGSGHTVEGLGLELCAWLAGCTVSVMAS